LIELIELIELTELIQLIGPERLIGLIELIEQPIGYLMRCSHWSVSRFANTHPP
jgi:hypothetical protein